MRKLRTKTTKQRRTVRSRSGIYGTSERPRLTVYRSNRYIYAQIIDDLAMVTLLTIDDIAKKTHDAKKKTEAAFELGKVLAERAKKAKIKSVVFDKGPYKYHGRVKSLAEGARKGGLNF